MTLDARDWQDLGRLLEAGAEECRHPSAPPWAARLLEVMRDKSLQVAAELHGAPVTWMTSAEASDLARQVAAWIIATARDSGDRAIVAVRPATRAAARLRQAGPAVMAQAEGIIAEVTAEEGVLVGRRHVGYPGGYLCAVDLRRFGPVPPGHPDHAPGRDPIDGEWMPRQDATTGQEP